jgi:hypothetical protein
MILDYVKEELQHVKKHWLSCIVTCVIVHALFEALLG